MKIKHYRVTAWFRTFNLRGSYDTKKVVHYYRDRDLAETKFLDLLGTSAYKVELQAVGVSKTKSEGTESARSGQQGLVSIDQAEGILEGKDMYGREEE